MKKTIETVGFAGLFAVLAAATGCGTADPGGEPSAPPAEDPAVGSSENALDLADPSADQVAEVAHLSRISYAVLDVTRRLPAREPDADQPVDCTPRELGCVSFDPCPEGAMGALDFADGGCAIPGTDIVLEGSIILVDFQQDPGIVEVAFEGLALRGNPVTGGFRLEAGEDSNTWSFEVSQDDGSGSISGSGTVTREGDRTTADITLGATNEDGTRFLVISGLTIVDGAEMPDGGSVAVVLDPPIGIPEDAIPEDLNGDGRVTLAEQAQRALLLAVQVSELGLVFLPTTPVDGRLEGYLNDPTNPLLTFCIDTDSQEVTYGPCA
ncbi:MAG: hypothetical protein HYY06_03510 [Deltaproteobacteria bacterium]|nr:hypothetical protein [Deltaproteobacteria bacterium]